MKNNIDTTALFTKMQANSKEALLMPPPSFTFMQCEVIAYDEDAHILVVKIPVLEDWLNPYSSMQGGIINAAIDNAIGPLSLLVAPANITRHMESKFLRSITLETDFILVKASLSEMKKRRLSFEVSVEDEKGDVFVHAKVVNFIL